MAGNKNTDGIRKRLCTAAACGDSATLASLLSSGATPNCHSEWQETPLHLAAAQNHADCVRLLLQQPSIEPNMLNLEQQTPLQKAIEYGATESMALLSAAPMVDIRKGKNEFAPIMRALYWGHETCVRQLLERQAIQSEQETMLALNIAAENGNPVCMQHLLQATEAFTTQLYKQGKTSAIPFNTALHAGHAESCELLLQSPLSVHITPELKAIFSDNEATLQANISKQIAVEYRTEQQRTLLHLAAMHGLVAAVRHLLHTAPNLLNMIDENGCTPLYLAADYGRPAVIHELLLHTDIDINRHNIRMETPLYSATWRGHADCVQPLLHAGANADIADAEACTPLYWAAYWGREECMSLLLKAQNVDINRINDAGETPLHIAAAKGKLKCLELLLQTPGIRLNIKDAHGHTPLRRAILKNHTTCATLLKKAMQRK